jgi:hypothetical protein
VNSLTRFFHSSGPAAANCCSRSLRPARCPLLGGSGIDFYPVVKVLLDNQTLAGHIQKEFSPAKKRLKAQGG